MPVLPTPRTCLLIGLIALSVGAIVGVLMAHRTADTHLDEHALTAQRIALGNALFNDSRLSADGAIRCASCHIPEKGYTDGRQVAVGVDGRAGTRNTPSLMTISAAQESAFFWDGRRAALNQAVLDPLTNPVEMGLNDQAEVLQRVQHNATYMQAFAQAFPNAKQPVALEQISTVLVDYVQSLKAPESAYDRYTLRGDKAALSQRALLGLDLFKGKGRCAECHQLEGAPATLTDHSYHRTGIGLNAIASDLPRLTQKVIQRSLEGSAIGNRVATHADEAQLGRFNVTQNPADIGLFRTPSLRDVSQTAPYMHDGSVATLDDAIDREVYYRSLQAGHPLQLTVEERADLKAFLQAL